MPDRTNASDRPTLAVGSSNELRFPSERVLRDAIAALLTRLPWGIRMVQILHGPQEAGKDIVFNLQGAFGEAILCACVVKNTRISGSVGKSSGAMSILHQAKQAFAIPYLGESGEQLPVQRVYVVTPYTLSPETTRSIQNNLTGDIQFISGPRLFDLFRTYWKDFLADEFENRVQEKIKELSEDEAIHNVSAAYRTGSIDRPLRTVYIEPHFCRPVTHYCFSLDLDTFLKLDSVLREASAPQDHLSGSSSRLVGKPRRWLLTHSMLVKQREKLDEVSSVIHNLAFLIPSTNGAALVESVACLLDELDAIRRRTVGTKLSKTELHGITAGVTELAGELDEAEFSKFKRRAAALRDRIEKLLEQLRDEVQSISALDEREQRQPIKALLRVDRRAVDRVVIKLPADVLRREDVSYLRFASDLIESVPKLLVTAAAGHGKTSFCRWYALKDLEAYNERHSGSVPVFVSLHKLRPEDVTSFETAFLKHSSVSALAARTGTRRLSYRFYLDGLDEVTSVDLRARVVTLLREQSSKDPKLRFVLTSRDYAVGPDLDWIPWVRLDDFSEEESSELVRRWLSEKDTAEFQAQLTANPILSPLLRVPLLATLTILIFRQTHNLPDSRSRLYRDVIDLMLSGWDVAKNVQRESMLTAALKLAIVRGVAWASHEKSLQEFDPGVVRKELQRLPMRGRHSTHQVIEELVVDGILQRVGDLYQFPHLSFQEYLAACDLFGDPRRSRASSVLVKFLTGDDWWREVMHFYVSLGSRQEEMEEWISCAVKKVKDAPEAVVWRQAGALREFTKALSPWLRSL